MRFSIVVVTWECSEALAKLTLSMNRWLSKEPQLLVIDNASGDDPTEAAFAWRGRTRVVRLECNQGFGRANNVGVRLAAEPLVVMLNPDTELIDSSLDHLARAAGEMDALVGPRMLNSDGSHQPSASGPVVGVWPWLNALVPGMMAPARWRIQIEPWRSTQRARAHWLTGACIAARREVLLRLGPFDPAIHLYSEDMDLGIRAAAAGIPSVFDPAVARVKHHGDVSSAKRFSDAGGRLSADNRRAVLKRAFGSRAEIRATRAQRLNLVLRARAKPLLGRSAERDRAALDALASASGDLELPEVEPSGVEASVQADLRAATISES